MTSKRSLNKRLAALEAKLPDEDEDPPAQWMAAVPRELWDDKVEAWRYFITGGESHPDLDPAHEDADAA